MKFTTILLLSIILSLSYCQISKKITIIRRTYRSSSTPTTGDFRSIGGGREYWWTWTDAFTTPPTWGRKSFEQSKISGFSSSSKGPKTQTNACRALITVLVLIIPQYLYQTICIVNEL
uniref:Uncharacterized protein n=1 Tax=Parastrongyloides trichosuri TaxID=131310 RepID=A0A0N4Z716_PARTI